MRSQRLLKHSGMPGDIESIMIPSIDSERHDNAPGFVCIDKRNPVHTLL